MKKDILLTLLALILAPCAARAEGGISSGGVEVPPAEARFAFRCQIQLRQSVHLPREQTSCVYERSGEFVFDNEHSVRLNEANIERLLPTVKNDTKRICASQRPAPWGKISWLNLSGQNIGHQKDSLFLQFAITVPNTNTTPAYVQQELGVDTPSLRFALSGKLGNNRGATIRVNCVRP